LKRGEICWVGSATKIWSRQLRADESDNLIRLLNDAFTSRFVYKSG